MGAETSIQWTTSSWNPIRGCSRVDDDCINCYAEGVAARFSGPGLAYEGLARRSGKGLPLWTGVVRMVPEHFADPLRWQKPRKIFANSMSDLFHEELSNEQIAAMFGVMAAAGRHTFQPLTKRAKRMAEWFRWVERAARECNDGRGMREAAFCFVYAQREGRLDEALLSKHAVVEAALAAPWPLPNVHLGVSAGFQRVADERIPYLLKCPAAVRWVSAEPLIGPVDLSVWLVDELHRAGRAPRLEIDWVVVGGESGSRARPFDIAWGRSIVEQCRVAGAPVFVKQMGSLPVWTTHPGPDGETERIKYVDGHGGDPAEWPLDLRVREFPRVTPSTPVMPAGEET